MSQSSSASASTASSSSSANSANQVQTNIPTSTVSAIGGGFIAFAIAILVSLTFLRMFKVWRDVKRRQRNGENVQFSQEWQSVGGFWGFLTGIGSRGGVDALVGAGGTSNMDIWRIYEQYGLGPGRKKEELRTPEMWEIQVPTKEKQGLDNVEWETLEPVSVSSKKDDSDPDDAVYSQLSMAVMILMPMKERKTITVDDEEQDDMPDIVIGTTSVLPMITSDSLPVTSTSSAASGKGSTAETDKGKLGDDVEEVEYVNPGVRRAKWQTQNGKWAIEGLQ